MLKWQQIAETNMIMITGVKDFRPLHCLGSNFFNIFDEPPLTGKRRIKGNCAGK